MSLRTSGTWTTLRCKSIRGAQWTHVALWWDSMQLSTDVALSRVVMQGGHGLGICRPCALHTCGERQWRARSEARLLDQHVYATWTRCGGKPCQPHPCDTHHRSLSNTLVPCSFDYTLFVTRCARAPMSKLWQWQTKIWQHSLTIVSLQVNNGPHQAARFYQWMRKFATY